MTLFEIFDPKAAPRPIGIDLGTSNSLVARIRDGRAEVIRDCNDQALMPSVVYYGTGGKVLVGSVAQAMALSEPSATLFSIKRLMGRGSDDPELQRLGTYDIVADSGPSLRVRAGGRIVTPVEVSAEILKALKQLAEDELRTVGPAVITVPAYFDDAQRQATKDAARLAGLEVLRLLNEPTAAAIAYGLDAKASGTFAVYDWGGGTFDITILRLSEGVFEVLATGGDSQLGGDDMDRALAGLLLQQAGHGTSTAEHATLDAARKRLVLDSARTIKHTLTSSLEVQTTVLGAEVTVTRSVFAALLAPLLEQTGKACRRCLKDAGLEASDLDSVILVGGATRVPAVAAYVEGLFGREPLCTLDPELVVAMGAALQAEMLAGENVAGHEALLLDVLPLSLGIETMGGVVEKLLPRNTTIPTGARQIFTTYADNQTGYELHVLQGERELAKDCRSLARFRLRGIPPMPAGMPRLELTFRVDENGILTVTAKELTTGVEQKVEVQPSYGLSDQEVEDMLIAAFDHGEEDLAMRTLVEMQVEAKKLLTTTQAALASDGDLLDGPDRAAIHAALDKLQDALRSNRTVPLRAAVDGLELATNAWAGRRMDRAVRGALSGQNLQQVEQGVAQALGVDAHVQAHAEGRTP